MDYKLLDSSKKIIADNVLMAESFFSRLKGLLGMSQLPPSTTLWIKSCNSVHTFFMKFNIDVLFVDSNLKIVAIKRNVKRNRLIFPVLTASHVFEFNSGELSKELKVGDSLYVET